MNTILKEIKEIKITRKKLRDFGLLFGIIFLGLAMLHLKKGTDYWEYILALSFLFIVLSFLGTSLLKPLYKIWMSFGIIIGSVSSKIILLITFYLVVTPFALVSKLFGNKWLDISFKDRKNSYWIPRDKTKIETKSYDNQF